MTHRRIFGAVLVIFGAWMSFYRPAVHAQGAQGPMPPKPGITVQKAPDDAIRVKVALVNAPVAVSDDKGELILDLQQKDFHVLDNGVEQTIESFDLGAEPLSAVLLFETSSRITPLMPAVQKSAIIFTQTVVGPSGEAAVLGYNDATDKLLPFTGDRDKIEKSIANLKIGSSGTRLYNALSEAVQMLKDRPADRRRVVILVGEARDAGSEVRLGEVLREAQLSNVVIYTVGLSINGSRVALTGSAEVSALRYASRDIRNAARSRHRANPHKPAATIRDCQRRSAGGRGMGGATHEGDRERSPAGSCYRGHGRLISIRVSRPHHRKRRGCHRRRTERSIYPELPSNRFRRARLSQDQSDGGSRRRKSTHTARLRPHGKLANLVFTDSFTRRSTPCAECEVQVPCRPLPSLAPLRHLARCLL